jgi:hypothetical protein
MTKTINVFCAGEQEETSHTLDIDNNGELVLTCVTDLRTEEELKDKESEPKLCGRFLKYPKGTTPDELKDLIEVHRYQNEGQITTESIEKEKEKILEAFEE